MIVSLFAHPIAFLAAVLSMMGYGWYTGWPEGSWIPLGLFVIVYLAGSIVLPWWTRPIPLYRYWKQRRETARDAAILAKHPRPEWMDR